MLVLTRRVGESIRIGDAVRLTILSKLRAHLTVALAVPPNIIITDETDMPVSPVRKRHRRGKRYLIAVMVGESLRIGEEVVVSFGGGAFGGWLGLASGRQVRINIDAPREIPVHREEVYLRIAQVREAQRSAGVTDAREIPGTVPAFAPDSVMPAPSAPVASLSRVSQGCRPLHRSDCR